MERKNCTVFAAAALSNRKSKVLLIRKETKAPHPFFTLKGCGWFKPILLGLA
jgi:hypothetical protein